MSTNAFFRLGPLAFFVAAIAVCAGCSGAADTEDGSTSPQLDIAADQGAAAPESMTVGPRCSTCVSPTPTDDGQPSTPSPSTGSTTP